MNFSLPELQQACFKLEVFMGDRPVGIIEWHQDRVLFQYYPGTRDTDFVSLLMPVRSQPYFSPLPGVLPPVFDMNLPEGSLRQTLVGRYGKVVQGFNDLALLRLVGRNSIGRLAFGMPPSPAPSPALDLDAVMQANDEEALVHLGAEDFCALSGMLSVHKYDGTYERAARTLTSLVSPAFSHQSRRGLFHTLALASVLRNGDAHLKNFTLLYTGAQTGEGPDVWLSPTYDLCTTNAYLPADMLALSLDGSKRYPSAQRLVKFATRHCGLSMSETDEVFKQVREGINAAQAELRAYCQANPAFGDTVGNTMLALWQAGLSASLPAAVN